MYPVCASATSEPNSSPSSYGLINSAGCPFPGSANKTSFTDATIPSMKSWAGANTAKPVTSITNASSLVGFIFMGGATFVPVTNITGIPTTVSALPHTLTGTVVPTNATNKTIVWTINNQGTTGATITNGNVFNATANGTAVVTATIISGTSMTTNYTQNFNITVALPNFTVNPPSLTFNNVPLNTTSSPQNITVTGSNLTGNVTWSLAGTGAGAYSITPTSLLPAGGELSVTLSPLLPINYNATLTISSLNAESKTVTLSGNGLPIIVPVTNITCPLIAAKIGIPVILNGTVIPETATTKEIEWTINEAASTATASISVAKSTTTTLLVSSDGTLVLKATVEDGKGIGVPFVKEFTIKIKDSQCECE
jgi:hypothetical protein